MKTFKAILLLSALSSTLTYAKDYLNCRLTDIQESPYKQPEFSADLIRIGTTKTAQLSIPGFLPGETYEVYVTHNEVDTNMRSFSEIKFFKGENYQRYQTDDTYIKFTWGQKGNPNILGSLQCRSYFDK